MSVSIRTLLGATLLVAIGTLAWVRAQPMTHFEIMVSGEVAEKLEPGSRIMIWINGEADVKPVICDIDDLPMRLPAETYLHKYVNASFVPPNSSASVCCVFLSQDLFDKPRRVNIKLDVPQPQLRPLCSDWRYTCYTSNVTQRMLYRTLPYWDESLGRLTPNPNVPHIRVVNSNTGVCVNEQEMTSCNGSRWRSHLANDLVLRENDRLVFSVEYDSGGLFDDTPTTFEFEYRPLLHGDRGITLR